MTTGERIKLIRKQLGMTQEQLAQRLGIGKAALSMIETGRTGLSSRNRNILVQELNVNPEWLDTGAGDAFNAEPDLTAYMLRTDHTLPMQSVPSTRSRARRVSCRSSPTATARARDQLHTHPQLRPSAMAPSTSRATPMYPLLKSGDIVLYKQLRDLDDIFWGDMYLLDRHRRRGVHHREVHPEVGAPGLRETREPEPPPCGQGGGPGAHPRPGARESQHPHELAPLTAARGRAQAASRSGTRRTERAARRPQRSSAAAVRARRLHAAQVERDRSRGEDPDTAPKPAPSNRGTANRCREGLGTGPPAARPQSETRRNVPQRRAANDKSHEKHTPHSFYVSL